MYITLVQLCDRTHVQAERSMFRFMYVGGSGIVLIFLLISCLSNQPTSPPLSHHPNYSVELLGLESEGRIIDGSLRAIAFNVIVKNLEQTPVADVPVHVWIDRGPGYLFSLSSETDSLGIVAELYFTELSLEDTFAVVKATIGCDTVSAVIRLRE